MNTSTGSLPIKKDPNPKNVGGTDLTANYKNSPGPRSTTANGA